MMNKVRSWMVCWLVSLTAAAALGAELRPPAVPLVTCDPYFSIWSPADKLTDADTVHWTGKPHRLTALISIDGVTYRVMGKEPADLAPLPQLELTVLPTQTIYKFANTEVRLTLTFLTPALPEDLGILSRPVTYLVWDVVSADKQAHTVQVEFSASGELAVNTPDQEVSGSIERYPGLAAAKLGSSEQAILAKRGDDIRIDWGYLYVAVPGLTSAEQVTVSSEGNGLPSPGGSVRATATLNMGNVHDVPVSQWLMLAYDDLYSIQYMKQNLRPFWRRNGWQADDLLVASAKEFPVLQQRCRDFDQELMADLTRVGGADYASLAALAFRQCFAAGKFVADDHGKPLQFSKENHSNGCIGTSDVFYPMGPQFLLFGPTLAKSFLVPFMNYAASERWTFPFAPHDLGQYPHANGQVYGGGERTEENQMPVEESGNLLILMAAIAQMEGHADFSGLYWKQLERWAAYLKDKGFDPENQLCTDDFAGHLAHNVNLSAKAICALGAFARLCDMRGEKALAAEYQALAQTYAQQWIKAADDGDHFRLAFDRPGTWSQKYNLVWDRILDLDLFPAAILRKEVDYYRQIQNAYGLPLDNRQTYTKLDWILWTATLTQDREDFTALVDPVVKFLNETPDRVPMTDWYFTDSARRQGFTARPVVGGVFLQMLYDQSLWNKYARRDGTKAADWAPMPLPPRTVTLVATSEQEPATWRYTTEQPLQNWNAADFDDSLWQEGPGGFGTEGTPGTNVRTLWNTKKIWIRRTFDLPADVPQRIALRMHHDEDAEVYCNGTRVAQYGGYTSQYETLEISPAALRPGRNVIAIHCRQTDGGQYIDAGLDAIVPDPATTTK
ncbi:MAG: glutaminase family protein [Pirellulaceae bacterium]